MAYSSNAFGPLNAYQHPYFPDLYSYGQPIVSFEPNSALVPKQLYGADNVDSHVYDCDDTAPGSSAKLEHADGTTSSPASSGNSVEEVPGATTASRPEPPMSKIVSLAEVAASVMSQPVEPGQTSISTEVITEEGTITFKKQFEVTGGR